MMLAGSQICRTLEVHDSMTITCPSCCFPRELVSIGHVLLQSENIFEFGGITIQVVYYHHNYHYCYYYHHYHHLPLTTSLNTGFRCFPLEKNLDNELERVFIFFFSKMDCSQLSCSPKSKTSESCVVIPWLKSDCEPEDADSTGEVNEDTGRVQLSKIKPLKLTQITNK